MGRGDLVRLWPERDHIEKFETITHAGLRIKKIKYLGGSVSQCVYQFPVKLTATKLSMKTPYTMQIKLLIVMKN